MQKTAVAFAVSLAVCLISMYVNYRAYQETHYLEWSYRSHGGEITIEFAPGWHSVHIYAMHPDDQDSHKLVFSPVPLAIVLLVLNVFNLFGDRSINGILTLVLSGLMLYAADQTSKEYELSKRQESQQLL